MPLFTYKIGAGRRVSLPYLLCAPSVPLPYPSSAPFTPRKTSPVSLRRLPTHPVLYRLVSSKHPHTAQISAAVKEGASKEQQRKKREEKNRSKSDCGKQWRQKHSSGKESGRRKGTHGRRDTATEEKRGRRKGIRRQKENTAAISGREGVGRAKQYDCRSRRRIPWFLFAVQAT